MITICFQGFGYGISYYSSGKDSGSTGYFIGSVLALIINYGLWVVYGNKYVNGA